MNKFQKILLAVMALVITAFYFFINLSETHFLPCIFQKITGFYCFGCGGQRAVQALLHGNFEKSFHYNLLVFIIFPLVGLRLVGEIFEMKSIIKLLQNKKTLIFYVLLLSSFMVLRNLPFEPFLQLIPAK